jgi:ABC-2 type transport system permease protein
MNTMKWLLKREYWEHKGGFFWAPAVVGALMSLVLAVSMIVAVSIGKQNGMDINGAHISDLSGVVTPEQKAEFVTALTHGYMGTGAPLFMVLAFVVFFFCLGSLFDERKDRSVLFWKSLPVSDRDTVLSKLATALVVAPLITLALATLTGLFTLLVVCIAAAVAGVNIFGAVLASGATYAAPFQVAALLPVYVLWALPTVGWLMMVSAWARTKPFLWAVGIPVLAGALLSWFTAMFGLSWSVVGSDGQQPGVRFASWFWEHIVARGLLSVAPGSWFAFIDPAGGLHHGDKPDVMFLVTQSWKVLGTANLWIGVAVGAAMIFAAIRLRKYRDEG